jgi:inner membrane protease ATP23
MSKPEQATDGSHPAAISKPGPAPPKLDPVYYNWSNTFSIMLGRMTGSRDVELEKNYFTELDATKAESICNRCESNKEYLLQYSPIIRFLSDEVYKLGGDLNKDNILCRMCTSEQSGGFSLNHGILLCANKFRNRGHQEDTMAHEMVHAWDHLKWKVEADNLKHQACLEVWPWQLNKSYWRLTFTDPRKHSERRVSIHTRVLHTESVEHHGTATSLCTPTRRVVHAGSHAKKVVNEVWESCFNDTRPFDEIYR